MTQEEKRIAWDKLTQEEKEKLEKRRRELIEWSMREREKVIKKIKAEGRWLGGLDGDERYPELVEVSEEYKKGFKELLELIEEKLKETYYESAFYT